MAEKGGNVAAATVASGVMISLVFVESRRILSIVVSSPNDQMQINPGFEWK
jgi:hypothetical protein